MGRSVGIEANILAEQHGLGLKYLSSGIFERVEGTDIELEVDGEFFKYIGDAKELQFLVNWMRARCRLYGGTWCPPRLYLGGERQLVVSELPTVQQVEQSTLMGVDDLLALDTNTEGEASLFRYRYNARLQGILTTARRELGLSHLTDVEWRRAIFRVDRLATGFWAFTLRRDVRGRGLWVDPDDAAVERRADGQCFLPGDLLVRVCPRKATLGVSPEEIWRMLDKVPGVIVEVQRYALGGEEVELPAGGQVLSHPVRPGELLLPRRGAPGDGEPVLGGAS